MDAPSLSCKFFRADCGKWRGRKKNLAMSARFGKNGGFTTMKGKILGAILGGLAGGPWGAALGLAAGHFFDSASSATARRENAFAEGMPALFYAVAKLAKIDGHISDAEIREIERIFSDLNFSPEMRKRAIECFRAAKSDGLSFFDSVERLADAFPTSEMRRAAFAVLARVAFADGGAKPEVAEALRGAANRLGLEWHYFDGSRGGSNGGGASREVSRSELSEAYAVLGVEPSASDAEIKRVYREKCRELHPDILKSKGIGNYALKALQDELCRVNDAYSLIQKYRK